MGRKLYVLALVACAAALAEGLHPLLAGGRWRLVLLGFGCWNAIGAAMIAALAAISWKIAGPPPTMPASSPEIVAVAGRIGPAEPADRRRVA